MKICGGVKTVFLRCVARALNSRRISNREIAIGAGVGIEAIVRLVSYGLLPSPAECEKLERFAIANLAALRPKPVKPIAERTRIKLGRGR